MHVPLNHVAPKHSFTMPPINNINSPTTGAHAHNHRLKSQGTTSANYACDH